LDNIDLECIFLKLKIFEDYDALSLNTLEKILLQFKENKNKSLNKSRDSKSNKIRKVCFEESNQNIDKKDIVIGDIGEMNNNDENNISKISSGESNNKINNNGKSKILDGSILLGKEKNIFNKSDCNHNNDNLSNLSVIKNSIFFN